MAELESDLDQAAAEFTAGPTLLGVNGERDSRGRHFCNGSY